MTSGEPFVTQEDELIQLEYLLKKTTEKILRYVGEASEKVGERYDAKQLYSSLINNGQIETPLKGYGHGDSANLDKVLLQVDLILEKSVNTWSLGFLDKLYASTNPIGIISDLVLSILNTNSHVFSVSPALSVIEKKVGKEYAKHFFHSKDHSHCGGLTFAGGSWSNITSMHMAKVQLFPETKTQGNGNRKFAVFASSHSHYSLVKSAILCGLGSDAVFKVRVTDNGEMDVEDLDKQIKQALNNGFTPFYVTATAGTTVFGSFDPVDKIFQVTKKYKLWLHVDGSWGGNFVFSDLLRYKLKGIEEADSITTNPHKQLGVPTTCSFLLLRNQSIFQTANSLNAPYLFHQLEDGKDENELGLFDLADGTLGCGRRADALKFYLSWYYYGKLGFKRRVEHAYEIAKYFEQRLSQLENFEVLNSFTDDNNAQKAQVPCLQVCFYYNPAGPSKPVKDHTSITRFISHRLHEQSKYLIDFAPYPDAKNSPKARGEFFRIVFINPKLSTNFIDTLIEDIVATGEEYS